MLFSVFARKERLSPAAYHTSQSVQSPKISLLITKRASFFTSLKGSLTIEAAVVLPVFLMCMAFFLHMGNVYYSAVRFSSAMTETAEELAFGAYMTEYGEKDTLLNTALTIGYSSAAVFSKAGQINAVQRANLLLSEFMSEGDMVDLVLTYQMKSPVGMLSLPWTFFVQRACVRGWTGRAGSEGGSHEEEGEHEHTCVYVTDYGRVYHTDPSCSHLRLRIEPVVFPEVVGRRNRYGEKYHACEHCGGGTDGVVYITPDGNRYHSSLSCSGLTRSVHEVTMEEADHLRPCSECAGKK